MNDSSLLRAEIRQIGQEAVECSLRCEGVENSDEILPRGLHLELQDRQGLGVVIVGLNPGRMDANEQSMYRRAGRSYDATEEWFAKNAFHIRFHKYLREFVGGLGFSGPILWTELAKCQNAPEIRSLPIQTLRTCVGRYLMRELDLVPDWTVIAVGREAYTALSYLFPRRQILGVPHSSGSFGHFQRLKLKSAILREQLPQGAVACWLPDLLVD